MKMNGTDKIYILQNDDICFILKQNKMIKDILNNNKV